MTAANDTNEPNQMSEPMTPPSLTEPNAIEFQEQLHKPAGHTTAVRVGIVAGSALLFVAGAVAVMGASPAPTTGAAPGATAAAGATEAPEASEAPEPSGAPGTRPERLGFGFGRGGFGEVGFRPITITAINGSDLSLKSGDGWTRTITSTSTTKITKGGATIAVGDLVVGDQIRFAEQKAADGSYSITAISVVLPTIAGQVTAINGDTLTVTQPVGATATIHVAAGTTYQVNGAAGSLSDIKVGSFIVAEGTQRTDGSLDAAAVHVGLGAHGFRGPGGEGPGGDHAGAGDPDASPAPSGATS